MQELRDHVAVITGASRRGGIGRACALRLAREGCSVVVTDLASRFEEFPDYPGLGQWSDIEDAAEEVRGLGVPSLGLRMDVSDELQVADAFEEVTDHFGRIDILVNNAGIRFGGPVTETSRAPWDQTFAVNARGVFLCSREAARHMTARGRGGRILNIASIGGLRGMKERAAYCSSKFAVVGLTQCLALELAPEGITVNAICPGRVDTALADITYQEYASAWGVSLEAAKARIGTEYVPTGRLLQPAEIAAAVAFLCSAEAAGITGQCMGVSGGEEVQLASHK